MSSLQTSPTLILISCDPNEPIAHHALRYCKAFCYANVQNHANTKDHANTKESVEGTDILVNSNNSNKLAVFFYADGARVANRLNWAPADRVNITQEWEQLAAEFNLQLLVCVSTALTRGVSDEDNAKRHQLNGDNLAQGFELVGLGVLADKMQSHTKIIQF